jgi:hypothetical protein
VIKTVFTVQEIVKRPAPAWEGSGKNARIYITTEAIVKLKPAFAGQSTPENGIFVDRPDHEGQQAERGAIELRLSSMEAAAFFERKIGSDVTVTFE